MTKPENAFDIMYAIKKSRTQVAKGILGNQFPQRPISTEIIKRQSVYVI